jgi:hypothetical protein
MHTRTHSLNVLLVKLFLERVPDAAVACPAGRQHEGDREREERNREERQGVN